MAEALKRWNGSEWVPVAAVNRIEIGGGESGGMFTPLLLKPIIKFSNLSINFVYLSLTGIGG